LAVVVCIHERGAKRGKSPKNSAVQVISRARPPC
jgi:hypothetical protein